MRTNLTTIQAGHKVRSIPIGELTAVQLDAINLQRSNEGLQEIRGEILFVGAHIYKSRIVKDGYEIDDILEEVRSAPSEDSVVLITPYMTAIQNPRARLDRLGNLVHDRAIFECTKYRPNPELFSVLPKGDRIKPQKK